MKKKRSRTILKTVFIAVVVLFVAAIVVRVYNSYRFHVEKQTRFMMDTFVTISAVGPKNIMLPAMDAAFDRMQEVDTKFNVLNPESPLYAFNQNSVPISDPEILRLARVALDVARESDGAFDITIAPLIELWGFYGDSPRLPQEKDIKACLVNVDYKYLTLDNGRLNKTNRAVHVDLGGIAKGYAVSEAVEVLKEAGVTSALIDAGGDIYALGNRGPRSWNVGIRNPRGDDLLGYVEVEDLAVLGSGDYERFFVENGKKYHHIFNPKTGYPAENLSGITTIYQDPTLADAWNTALFVLGPEEGLEMVEKIPGMEAVMVTTSGQLLYSSGFKDRLKGISKIS